MKRKLVLLTLLMVIGMTGCDKQKEVSESPVVDSSVNSTVNSEMSEDTTLESITSDQALEAIKNYCVKQQPDLADMANSDDYTIYWEVESSDADQIVVLYRSYTGAQVRYYVDPKTGDVYVTEFMSGITEEEERTEETFNVKEYMPQRDNDVADAGNAKENASVIEGTWQSASIVDVDGVAQAEFVIQFTDKAINYGHINDSEFVLDYSDEISTFEEIENNRYRVQAKNSNGVQYTYLTSETDSNVMEYFETWNEAEFADTYRGGASISR